MKDLEERDRLRAQMEQWRVESEARTEARVAYVQKNLHTFPDKYYPNRNEGHIING